MEIDQIFVGIHVRCARLVSSVVPRPLRSVLQAGSLLMSLFLLTSLIWLHHQHIHPQGTHYSLAHSNSTDAASSPAFPSSSAGSFPSLVDWMQDSDVLRLRIEPPSSQYDLWRARGWSSWWKDRDRISVSRHAHEDEDGHVQHEAPQMRGQWVESGTEDGVADVAVEVAPHPSQQPSSSTFTLRPVNRPPNFSSSPALPLQPPSSSSADSCASASSSVPSLHSRHVYEYAHHKGYFLLPASLHARHRVVTTTVTMSASHRAFGPFPLSFFTYHVYGYDSIVLNHLIRQMRLGFMRNAHTSDIYTISSQQHKHSPQQQQQRTSVTTGSGSGSVSTVQRLSHLLYLLFFKSELLVTTLFLFFATTTLVSSTLTQTQLRMLHFTDQLRQHIRLQLPIVGLVLEHTMQSLSFVPVVVGILFFLFEFFNDHVLAFLLLMLVWLCESYTVLFTRHSTSMLYFPKLFALYFLMFSVYFFSFPYGFHYIAMGLTASQLYTCILYYWFDYEIPAVEAGDISIHRPRMLVLRRADGGERDREEASTAHASSDNSDRARGLLGDRRAEHDERGMRSTGDSSTSNAPVRSAFLSRAADDGSDMHEFEFSRRSLPRISTSSTLAPARSAASIGSASASAAPSAASLLPVPSAMSSSSSAPGSQALRRASEASRATLLPAELASPLPFSLSPRLTSAPLTSVSAPAAQPSWQLDSQADTALQRLASLPPLLHTLLRHTQQLKAQYATPASPSPRHPHAHTPSHSHRARAASVASPSPSLSPSYVQHKDELQLLSDARQALTIALPLMSLSSESAMEEHKELSELATTATWLRPAAPTPMWDVAAMHRLVLDQLSNVLQVALYALTTVVHNPTPATATLSSVFHTATSTSPTVSGAVTGEAAVGAGSGSVPTGLTVHSPPAVPTSPVCRSPRSPHSLLSPPPLPRSSPPSSHRTSASSSLPQSLPSTAAAAPVRRLLFSQRSSVSGGGHVAVVGDKAVVAPLASAAALDAAAGGNGRRTGSGSEPASPDPESDAPMM